MQYMVHKTREWDLISALTPTCIFIFLSPRGLHSKAFVEGETLWHSKNKSCNKAISTIAIQKLVYLHTVQNVQERDAEMRSIHEYH
jgi:hypothetical protein